MLKRPRTAKKCDVLYIEWMEKNGWERETWRTFVPYDTKDPLCRVVSNMFQKLNHYMKNKPDHTHTNNNGPGAHVCVWCTTFHVSMRMLYTGQEAHARCRAYEDEARYSGHGVCSTTTRIDKEALRKLCKQMKQGTDEAMMEVFETLYKGGWRHVLLNII